MVASVSMTRVVQVALCISLLIVLANCRELKGKLPGKCGKPTTDCKARKNFDVSGTYKATRKADCPCDCEEHCKTYNCKAWVWKNGYCKYYTSYSGSDPCIDCYCYYNNSP